MGRTEVTETRDLPGRSHPVQVLAAIAFWGGASLLAVRFGAVSGADWEMVAQLRLPRVILATAIGAGLSVAGATLQALFANPLCEPYTLGISSGAALGAALGTTLGIGAGFAGLAIPAFAGGLFFALILYGISLRSGTNNLTLLLAGVMLQFLGSSLVALWMALADAAGVQSATFWLLGDLSRARLSGGLFSVGVMTFLIGMIWLRARDMDAMMMGEDIARSLGVPVGKTRRSLLLASALLVGLCVSGSGMIGFVGLVIPHFVRRVAGSLHRRLLPLCAIWGAGVLVAADLVSRVLISPLEVPVGVVTALAGAPLFLWIMLKGRGATA